MTTKPATSTARVRARRERMGGSGWTLVQVELSPTASAALAGLLVASGHTRSQVIEQAVAEMYDRMARAV